MGNELLWLALGVLGMSLVPPWAYVVFGCTGMVTGMLWYAIKTGVFF